MPINPSRETGNHSRNPAKEGPWQEERGSWKEQRAHGWETQEPPALATVWASRVEEPGLQSSPQRLLVPGREGPLSPGVRRDECLRDRAPWKAEQIRSKWVTSSSSIFFPTIRGQQGAVNRHAFFRDR